MEQNELRVYILEVMKYYFQFMHIPTYAISPFIISM